VKRIIILLTPLTIFTLFFVLPGKIVINKVSCVSSAGKCSSALEDSLSKYKDSSLIVALTQLPALIEASARVESYSIRFFLPNNLTIYVSELSPVVAVKAEGKSEYILITENGDKVDTVEATDLPVIITKQNITDDQILYAAQLLTTIHKIHGVNEGELYNGYFLAKLLGNVEFIYPTAGDIDVLLGSTELLLFQLNSLLEKSKIEEVSVNATRVVDLRYTDPVIRYR